MSAEFENALYSHLKESSSLASQEIEISAHSSAGASVYVSLKSYNGRAFADAVVLSTDFTKEKASSYGLVSPKLSVVAGAGSGINAAWTSEDLEKGTWVDTAYNIGSEFPLKALQGTYYPGTTDDYVVYKESGGHWRTYHSDPNCTELAHEIKQWEDYLKTDFSPFGVAKSSLAEDAIPCDVCIGGKVYVYCEIKPAKNAWRKKYHMQEDCVLASGTTIKTDKEDAEGKYEPCQFCCK